jgi:predicted nucleotidyltransferase
MNSIKKVYVSSECLRFLTKLKTKDNLQRITLEFVNLLSNESGVAIEDFGVHGSVALNMHMPTSDIDIVVYGSRNFRELERTVKRLAESGTLSYVFSDRLDAARLFKGHYKNKIFMYNAVRKPEEINSRYGEFKYTATAPVRFHCTVEDDNDSMFRPAIYKIEDYTPDPASALPKEKIPKCVVSMIGCYRNVAKKGDEIRVSGMLERVEHLTSGNVFYQVVVGTGTSEEEHIWPP